MFVAPHLATYDDDTLAYCHPIARVYLYSRVPAVACRVQVLFDTRTIESECAQGRCKIFLRNTEQAADTPEWRLTGLSVKTQTGTQILLEGLVGVTNKLDRNLAVYCLREGEQHRKQ